MILATLLKQFDQKRRTCGIMVLLNKKLSGTQEQITNAWKAINEECRYPTKVLMPLLNQILNLACVIDVVYKTEDAGVMLKDFVATLLFDPIPLYNN
ncbi:hypothetical protein REPUB_Repub05bG0044400 [Reevesia pubescens]